MKSYFFDIKDIKKLRRVVTNFKHSTKRIYEKITQNRNYWFW